jgi:hypothetical protein
MKRHVLAATAALSLLTTAARADTIVNNDIGTTTATFTGGLSDTLFPE